MRIIASDPRDPGIVALLETHVARAHAETAPGSAHALDPGALAAPGISFWAAWEGNDLLGVGALKRLPDSLGEVKSMHTVELARGRGVAGAILERIVGTARDEGLTALYLETGSWPYFAPARAFYARHGFAECPPFGDYMPDPNSVFMMRAI